MPSKGHRLPPPPRVLFLVVAFLIALLSFGQPLAAYADPTPSDTPAADQKPAAEEKSAGTSTSRAWSTPPPHSTARPGAKSMGQPKVASMRSV